MASPNNRLPVYGQNHDLLYEAPIASVPRLIESGRVKALGTRRRVRALVAVCGAAELLALEKPKAGTYFSNTHETDSNPKGVWTFRRAEAYA